MYTCNFTYNLSTLKNNCLSAPFLPLSLTSNLCSLESFISQVNKICAQTLFFVNMKKTAKDLKWYMKQCIWNSFVDGPIMSNICTTCCVEPQK